MPLRHPPFRADRRQAEVPEGHRFEIAVEHACWCSAAGFTPREVILSVNEALPISPTWSDAIYALVYAQISLERERRQALRGVAA